MSYLLNSATGFTQDMVRGFVAAHGDLVRQVDGGVVRASGTPEGTVAVVIGGGSGHYPAFAGLVGPGLAHGAAMGNVFASPSTGQAYAVARAADAGAGVLFSYGNYAGDVLNFDLAQDRLNDEGIATRTVVVTDDISSAPPARRETRRGVAGDLVVFRAAAWAAERGDDLDAVAAFAAHANERTRTLGVAFSGCTLPGADHALFGVPAGRMALGMGIHGEPGLEELPLPTADELADLLTQRVLAETPDGAGTGGTVAVMVNGLGSVKSEELFVLYGRIADNLGRAGLRTVRPEVGEYATSFEMAGVSLTLAWLDDDLERAWTSPANAPGYRRGDHGGVPRATVAPAATHESGAAAHGAPTPATAPASAESREAAAAVAAVLDAVRRTVDEHVDELGRLDSVAGDGDHGIGMQRGATAAAEVARSAAADGAGAGPTLSAAADAWADRAGGTSGVLWGIGLRALAEHLASQDRVTGPVVSAGVRAAAAAISARGGADAGDKTMLDALLPFADRLEGELAQQRPLADAWAEAARAAVSAAAATAELLPRTGRARTHAQGSVGTPDPGAVSFGLAAAAAADVLAGTRSLR